MNQQGFDAQVLRDILKPMVALFVEQVTPTKNEISQNQAYHDYGRAWVEKQISDGNLTPRIKGNRKLLSRSEIECLIAVEKTPAHLVIKGI